MRLATELISTSLWVRHKLHSRRMIIKKRGRVKSDVLKYVTKNGLEKVLSANIVCPGQYEQINVYKVHIPTYTGQKVGRGP